MLTSVVSDISLGEAGAGGLMGYGVVFLGLVLLMVVVVIMGKVMSAKKTAAKEEKPAPAAAPVSVSVTTAPEAPAAGNLAPGSAGRLKLYDTPPKAAAMCMAIVADQLGKPLNELRFISIKEVK